MTKIPAAIEHYWGIRCPDFDETCPICQAWAEYDADRVTQEIVIDDEFYAASIRAPKLDVTDYFSINVFSGKRYKDINMVYRQLEIAQLALAEIKHSGKAKPGHGYTCAKIAEQALLEINK